MWNLFSLIILPLLCLFLFYSIAWIIIIENMGCQPSSNVGRNGQEIKITIIDSSFVKSENDSVRKDMLENNIKYQCFISMECFQDQFSKRYYNKVVTSLENYENLKGILEDMNLTPKIFVILNGRPMNCESDSSTVPVQSYQQLIKLLRQNASNSFLANQPIALAQNRPMIDVKILTKSGPISSQEAILEAVLKKAGIKYEFFGNFQQLENSVETNQAKFVITEHMFHTEVVELFRPFKSKIICYCTLDNDSNYSPELYLLSDNYLDIANEIKAELKQEEKTFVKCSKVYLYVNGLPDCNDIKSVIENFDIEVREFSNIEKVIKETTYFFCVSVVAAESQLKNLSKFFQRNDYVQKIKLIGIPNNTQPTLKGLNKVIRNIRKGYSIKKGVTNSVDIIDKHYNSIKFEEIQKELDNNNIKCFGFSNISEYIKKKKFISSFIICNYEERTLLVKYMKQLQCKSKIIVFCNKNKIDAELKNSKAFVFVSSHFGKIIKFIKKTHVFLPSIVQQDDQQFKEKIDKIKSKNKRISAIKWSQINIEAQGDEKEENFEFLNIAKDTNNGSIRDIQKSVATIWKTENSLLNLETFKQSLIESFKELRKIHKINSSETQFSQLIDLIKTSTFSTLIDQIKTFFDSDNELGLQINKSLMRTESLEKKEITNMREFLLLVFMNYFSGYKVPKVGRKKVTHWISNSLIEKCEVGSYLFCKHFLIFYENSDVKLGSIGKYKMELDVDYNTLVQSDLLVNSFMNYKDKTIFSPFSQFSIEAIQNKGEFKVIKLKHIKNVDFLKYIYQDNFKISQNLDDLKKMLMKPDSQLVDPGIQSKFTNNIDRLAAIEHFQKGQIQEAVEIHKRLIKESQESENLDSCLVTELNFELACFYFKGEMNREAGALLKEVLDAVPGELIKEECEKMIQQVFEEGGKQENKGSVSKRRISEQAMKTFIWLKNKEMQENKQDEKSASSSQDVYQPQQNQLNLFQKDINCIQVDDEIDQIKEVSDTIEPRKEKEKENIEIQ